MRSEAGFNNSAGPAQQPHSAWHSPVPYLFGGLAAMLGLIAFALLILACSYWKLSGYLEGGSGGDGDVENGAAGKSGGDAEKAAGGFLEERIVVIVAGKPTFLATPMSSRASSFGDNCKKTLCEDGEKKSEGGDSTQNQTQTQTQNQNKDLGQEQ